jgi:hypothetical protein
MAAKTRNHRPCSLMLNALERRRVATVVAGRPRYGGSWRRWMVRNR